MNIVVDISATTTLPNGLPVVSLTCDELGSREVIDLDFEALQEGYPLPNPLVVDLLVIACVVYTTDKTVRRRTAEDFWTRDLSLTIPVSDPEQWARCELALVNALNYLTGDQWSFAFIPRTVATLQIRNRRRQLPQTDNIGAVSLFSGGADSLVGILNQLAETEDSMILVGHRDASATGGDQSRMRTLLTDSPDLASRMGYRTGRIRPLPASRSTPEMPIQPSSREHTLRSRSFVFLAMGVYAAQQVPVSVPLLIPENGFIAINIPLTMSRVGSCSTRTTHPHYLSMVRTLLQELGIDQPILNPLGGLTKGEVLSECRNQEELCRLLPDTVSCAHSSRRGSWHRRSARNCGYCVPCLVRRASLHHVQLDHGSEYGIDVFAGEIDLDSTIATDFRAVLDCLEQTQADRVIEDRVTLTGPLAYEEIPFHSALVERGLEELRVLVAAKANPVTRTIAGLR